MTLGQSCSIGYSPNTPPPQNNGYGRPSSRDPYGGGTLGDHIANMVRGVFDGVWGVSHTVVRVDLLRPLKYRGPIFQAASSADDNDRQAGLPPPQQQGYYPTPAEVEMETIWDFPETVAGSKMPYDINFGGLEFDEQVVELGKHTALRVAATLHFPRRIPLPPGEQPFRISMNRLGLKARIA
eukprot:jgi/Mesen1/3096/ME000184S02164